MTKNPVTRRGVLAGGAAVGLSAVVAGSAKAADRVFIPFSNKSLSYYFFVIEQEAVRRAVEAHHWEFQATNANFSNSDQLQQWQSLMLKEPSAIVSDPIDSQAIVSVIQRYNMRKIPVAIIDTPAEGGDVAITISFDNRLGGVMAAQQIISRLTKKYGSPKGIVLNCYGALASVAWRERKEGMDAEFAKYPDIKYLDRPANGELDQEQSVTLSTLSEYPNLDAVTSPSDSPSRGAATALKQKGRWKKVGEEGHIIFVNIDGSPNGLQWIREGYMDADISQDPIAYGEIAVEMLAKHSLKGQAVPLGVYENNRYYWEKGNIVQGVSGPTLILPPYVIDSTNVDDPRHWGNIAANQWKIPYD